MTEDQTPEPADAEFEPGLDASPPDSAALQAEVSQLKEQVLRFAADAENTRRRAEKEANDARAYAIQRFASDLLGVADNLSRALQATPKDVADPTVKNFVLGIEMTEKELQSAFARSGLKKLDPERGSKFDPHQHQAVTEQPATDVDPGSVLQVLQTGYELHGRIVRPAMVAVAAKAPPAPEPASPYAAANGEDVGGSVDTKA